jgi:hypothetical protein
MYINEEKLLSTKVINLFRYSKCFCKKNLIYVNCEKCQKKYKIVSNFFKHSLDDFKDVDNAKGSCCILNECWFTCNDISIRSHTISRKAHLESITKLSDKKVYTLNNDSSYLLNKNEYSTFDDVSSKFRASIFYGLCKKHDDIYSPIDNNFDPTKKEHIILLSHRQSLYELHKKIEMLKLFQNIKEIFKNISKNKLESTYRKIIPLISSMIQKKINDINFLINDLKIEINNFKEDFDIVNNKAVFKQPIANKYIYSVIKFEKNMNFSFSTKFAPKYTFNEQIIHIYWDYLKYSIQSPTIGLINHKNNSYFYCISLNNKENLHFTKTLTNAIELKINTLLKCAIMTDNTYFSEEFVLYCKNLKTPSSNLFTTNLDKFETVDKLLGYLNLQDSIISSQHSPYFDGELERIKNINNIDLLKIIPKNAILKTIKEY